MNSFQPQTAYIGSKTLLKNTFTQQQKSVCEKCFVLKHTMAVCAVGGDEKKAGITKKNGKRGTLGEIMQIFYSKEIQPKKTF